jgi:hypothetical protein
MSTHMDKTTRIWLLFGIVVLVAILAAFWANSTFLAPQIPLFGPRIRSPYETPQDLEFYYTAQTVLSTVNVILAIFLLLTYVEIYRKTKSEFTIGLIIFSTAFLLNALVSNPFVIAFFRYYPVGLGPFALLPQIFTSGALLVLLYLSIRY